MTKRGGAAGKDQCGAAGRGAVWGDGRGDGGGVEAARREIDLEGLRGDSESRAAAECLMEACSREQRLRGDGAIDQVAAAKRAFLDQGHGSARGRRGDG